MTSFDASFLADAILCADEPDTPIAVWTLDELEHNADLDSVLAARARTNGLGSLHAG